MGEISASVPPVFVFAHGAFHRPEHFDLVRGALLEQGYESRAADLPVDDPNLTIEDDIQALVDTAKGLDNVVIIGHSRAGDFVPRAVERLQAARRVGVFLCASGFGVQLPTQMPQRNTQRYLSGILTLPGGLTAYNPCQARKFFYPRHPGDEIAAAYENVTAIATLLLRPQRPRTTPPEPPPSRLPACIEFYSIHATRDTIVSPLWSQVAEAYLQLTAIAIPDGHSPFITNPRRTARILVELVTKGPSNIDTIPLPRPRRVPAAQRITVTVPTHKGSPTAAPTNEHKPKN